MHMCVYLYAFIYVYYSYKCAYIYNLCLKRTHFVQRESTVKFY